MEQLADQVASGAFQNVPIDVLYIIVRDYLHRDDIANLCLTSSYFRDRICQPSKHIREDRFNALWSDLYARDFTETPLPPLTNAWNEYQHENAIYRRLSVDVMVLRAVEEHHERMLDNLLTDLYPNGYDSKAKTGLNPATLHKLVFMRRENPFVDAMLTRHGINAHRCEAITRTGSRCTRVNYDGARYCFQHKQSG